MLLRGPAVKGMNREIELKGNGNGNAGGLGLLVIKGIAERDDGEAG